jgi:UDP-N-acetylmuramyl pentapeptide phosphotransferase/UDP-N-acetylglucosamine-1-phosphate transferase
MTALSVSFQLALLLGSFVLATGAVEVVRRHALRNRLLDVPNDRSSHTVPTARGGGLGVITVVALLWSGAIVAWAPPARVELTLCLAAMVSVAAVGWLDDKGGLGVRPRLLVHVLAGGTLAVLSARVGWHWTIALWWALWTVSSINVVNFMDGIDGLIASQTVIAALSIATLAPADGLARPFALAIAGATGGFLLWNWPPARIFLGDVGSGALGFALVLAGALVVSERGADFVRAFCPLFPLFLDAAWTILRRARRGERLTAAHRSHLYQRLANGGWGHARVTVLYAAAATMGALIAAVPAAAWRWSLFLLYGAAVAATGWRLSNAADRAEPRS